MRTTAIAALLSSAFLVGPVMMGCDRELRHDETVKTNSDGTQTRREDTTVQHPDGSVTHEEHKTVNNGNNP